MLDEGSKTHAPPKRMHVESTLWTSSERLARRPTRPKMLRATRGAFLSARQLRRAASKRSVGSPAGGRGAGGGSGGRRDVAAELLFKDEGIFAGQQRRAFGKAYAETVGRTALHSL